MKSRLPLTAVLLTAISATSSIAQPVETYTLSLVPGFNLIANHFNIGGNTLPEVFPTVPDLTVVQKYDSSSASYLTAEFEFGVWEPPDLTLGPGEGAFIRVLQPTDLTFRGTPVEHPQPLSLALGQFHMVSSQIAREARFEDIVGHPPTEGAELHRWSAATGEWDVNNFTDGYWDTSEPIVAVGEAVMVRLREAYVPTVDCGRLEADYDHESRSMILRWGSEATLISSRSIDGPWTPIANASSPHEVVHTGSAEFFQLRCESDE